MKTIFFDWGGVIADDPGDDFLVELLREVGASEEQIQEIFHSYMRRFMRGEISETTYWDELRSKYGFSIHDSISEEFKRWKGLAANRDILNLVDEAKASGWQVAILSNVIEPTYNVLEAAGFYDTFDVVIASCKEGFAKPDIQIYAIALEKLNTTADESIFIDDKQSNLLPAKEMGFKTILAQSPEQIIRDTKDLLASPIFTSK